MKRKPPLQRLVVATIISVAAITAVDRLMSGQSATTNVVGPREPKLPSAVAPEHLAIAPPPFSEDIFPCTACHVEGAEVDLTRRELAFHDEINFEHDAANRWCLDCHNADNRDRLHLADGRPVEFTESYRLCGQCHGPQLKHWMAGDHGRRTGSWSGTKHYLLCANCHDPHSPRYKPIQPEPAPMRQEAIR